MTDRELMQMALDALDSDNPDIQLRAATHLRAVLAQPEPEPLPAKSKGALSHDENKQHNKMILDKFYEDNAHLYTAPPQREWQGLTPEEAKEISLANRPYVIDMIAALEKRLKEKNT